MVQVQVALDFSLTERFFNTSPNGLPKPIFEMPASQWHNAEMARRALEHGVPVCRAISLELPASYAGLSLLNLMLIKLLFLAQDERMLDLSLDHLVYQIQEEHDYGLVGYRIREMRWTDVPESGREAFLTEAWRTYVTKEIRPAVERIAEQAGVKPDMIWNQFGSRVAGIREYLGKLVTDPVLLARYDDHMRILTDGLTPEDFGRRRNPFIWKPRYIDDPRQEGARMMLRSSCCMYDKREGGQKCYNCPKMTPEEREARKTAMVNSQGGH
jgi:ferric iron reductase protein FhuF